MNNDDQQFIGQQFIDINRLTLSSQQRGAGQAGWNELQRQHAGETKGISTEPAQNNSTESVQNNDPIEQAVHAVAALVVQKVEQSFNDEDQELPLRSDLVALVVESLHANANIIDNSLIDETLIENVFFHAGYGNHCECHPFLPHTHTENYELSINAEAAESKSSIALTKECLYCSGVVKQIRSSGKNEDAIPWGSKLECCLCSMEQRTDGYKKAVRRLEDDVVCKNCFTLYGIKYTSTTSTSGFRNHSCGEINDQRPQGHQCYRLNRWKLATVGFSSYMIRILLDIKPFKELMDFPLSWNTVGAGKSMRNTAENNIDACRKMVSRGIQPMVRDRVRIKKIKINKTNGRMACEVSIDCNTQHKYTLDCNTLACHKHMLKHNRYGVAWQTSVSCCSFEGILGDLSNPPCHKNNRTNKAGGVCSTHARGCESIISVASVPALTSAVHVPAGSLVIQRRYYIKDGRTVPLLSVRGFLCDDWSKSTDSIHVMTSPTEEIRAGASYTETGLLPRTSKRNPNPVAPTRQVYNLPLQLGVKEAGDGTETVMIELQPEYITNVVVGEPVILIRREEQPYPWEDATSRAQKTSVFRKLRQIESAASSGANEQKAVQIMRKKWKEKHTNYFPSGALFREKGVSNKEAMNTIMTLYRPLVIIEQGENVSHQIQCIYLLIDTYMVLHLAVFKKQCKDSGCLATTGRLDIFAIDSGLTTANAVHHVNGYLDDDAPEKRGTKARHNIEVLSLLECHSAVIECSYVLNYLMECYILHWRNDWMEQHGYVHHIDIGIHDETEAFTFATTHERQNKEGFAADMKLLCREFKELMEGFRYQFEKLRRKKN